MTKQVLVGKVLMKAGADKETLRVLRDVFARLDMDRQAMTLATCRGKSSRTVHPGNARRRSLCRCRKARKSSAMDVVTRYRNAIPPSDRTADREPVGEHAHTPRRPCSDGEVGQAFRW